MIIFFHVCVHLFVLFGLIPDLTSVTTWALQVSHQMVQRGHGPAVESTVYHDKYGHHHPHHLHYSPQPYRWSYISSNQKIPYFSYLELFIINFFSTLIEHENLNKNINDKHKLDVTYVSSSKASCRTVDSCILDFFVSFHKPSSSMSAEWAESVIYWVMFSVSQFITRSIIPALLLPMSGEWIS